MGENAKKWRGRIIRYAPLILWIAVIFINSSTIGASKNTSLIIRPLLEWLFPLADAATLDIYHGYIRKLAHFTEYGILVFLAACAFWNSSARLMRNFWFVAAFLLVAAIASLDEYNQSFNTLRTSSPSDVLLDCAGGLTVILLLVLYRRAARKKALSGKSETKP